MRAILTRVNAASVTIDHEVVGQIGKGFLILLGFGPNDTEKECRYLAEKALGLRIFEDENGKTNLSLKDVNGELLLVSQFTLYADCSHGNRPSFINAGKPELAKELYEYIIDECKKQVPVVETGEFGADMKVALENDGPFTIVLDID